MSEISLKGVVDLFYFQMMTQNSLKYFSLRLKTKHVTFTKLFIELICQECFRKIRITLLEKV